MITAVKQSNGVPGLQVRCGACGVDYDWGTNCRARPYVQGEGNAAYNRIAYEVTCPGCKHLEGAWSLTVAPTQHYHRSPTPVGAQS